VDAERGTAGIKALQLPLPLGMAARNGRCNGYSVPYFGRDVGSAAGGVGSSRLRVGRVTWYREGDCPRVPLLCKGDKGEPTVLAILLPMLRARAQRLNSVCIVVGSILLVVTR
jgi:hypothetical protein